MLGYFCDDTIVGYYTNAVKLDKVTVGLIASIGTVLLPRLSLYVKNGEIKKINLLITRVIMIITFLVIPICNSK
jgi:O-antigen/teichoic acid export membrane protein